MELIYLYIEDYKNIKNQGFNFSSKFTWKYDEVKKTLQIDEKNNHIENFFGENINITAIVGENGSGKSNLIKCLGNTFSENKIIVYFINNIILTNYSLNSIKNQTKYKIEKTDSNLNNVIFLNRNFFMETPNTSIFRSLYLENSNLYLKYFNFDKDKLTLDINSFHSKILKNILLKNYKTTFFNPTKIKIVFNHFSKGFVGSKIKKDTKNNLEEYKYTYKFYLKSLEIVEKTDIPDKEKLKNLHTSEMIDFSKLTEGKILKYDYQKYDDTNITSLINKDDNIYSFLDKYFVDKEINLLRDKEFSFGEAKKIEFLKTTKDIEVFLYLNRIGFLDYDFFDDKKLFSSLSSGEKSFFSDIVILNNEIEEFLKYKEDKSYLYLILDEPETTFHPQWQKKYIDEIIKFLNNFEKIKIYLILTSHSPFILSDIPKQNIIFLKDGKQVDAMEKKQTFGANIHTLLADGFFMDGGLMGEFAKAKIEKVIKYLNDKNLEIKSKEEAQKIINIIGEPILKNQLQKMLDSKNLSEVDKIKQDIKALQNRLEELENGKN